MASPFDRLETALTEEAMSRTDSATQAENVAADLDKTAYSSAASTMLKMEEDESPIANACEAEDDTSNLDALLSAEMKAERTIVTPLRLPIPQRDGQQPLSPASSSTLASQVEADYGSATA